MKPSQFPLVLFLLLLFAVTYSHQKKFDAATPVSRLDLLHALVVHQSIRIDDHHENTPDKAIFKGSYFSDKAPGTAFLASLPFVVATGILLTLGIGLESDVAWLFSSWMASAGSIGLITALGGKALYEWLTRHVPPKDALLTTFAIVLGSASLPYSTMMFSHALVIGLLAIAIWAIEKQQLGLAADRNKEAAPLLINDPRLRVRPTASPPATENVSNRPPFFRWMTGNRYLFLAGHACGWALASEYSSGIVVLGLLIWLIFRPNAPQPPRFSGEAIATVSIRQNASRYGKLFAFAVAALPPLLLIPAYNFACFESPFILPYSLQASFPEMKEGLYAIQWPNLETLVNLLFSPMRGLFFWTPFFILAWFGYHPLFKNSPSLFWLTYIIPLLHIIIISGRTWDWQAGPAWGPRLLSPIIPLFALPCALGLRRLPRFGIVLAVYSVAITSLATLTDACPSLALSNPFVQLNVAMFRQGTFSPNLGMIIGMPAYVSIAFYYAVLIAGFVWLQRQLGRE